MTTPITRDLVRILRATDHRGNTLVVKISPDGLRFKLASGRWSKAVHLPWEAAYSVACKMAVAAAKKAKAEARAARKAGKPTKIQWKRGKIRMPRPPYP